MHPFMTILKGRPTEHCSNYIGDSTGGPEGAQAPLLKNKFLKILGKGCSID